MAPLAVGMKRYTDRTPLGPRSALFKETHHVEIWACNSLLAPKEVILVVEAFELLSGARIYVKQEEVVVDSNRSTELATLEVPVFKADPSAAVVVSAKLVDAETKVVLSRFLTYPEP